MFLSLGLSEEVVIIVYWMFFNGMFLYFLFSKFFMSEKQLEQFKETFKKEFAGVQDIAELKELFATELAKRDKLIAQLQEQNTLLLQSAFRQKKEQLQD